MSKLYDKYFNDEKKAETKTETNDEVSKLMDEVIYEIGTNQQNLNFSPNEVDCQISKIGDNKENIKRNTIQGQKNSKVMLIMVCSIFTLVGICLMFFAVSNTIKYFNYEEAEAEVVYVRTYRSTGSQSSLMAVPTYEFYVDGVAYRVESSSSVSVNIAPRVGDKETIKYNPKNPNEILNFSWTIILFYVMGAAFGGIGILILILTLTGKIQNFSSNNRKRANVNFYHY